MKKADGKKTKNAGRKGAGNAPAQESVALGKTAREQAMSLWRLVFYLENRVKCLEAYGKMLEGGDVSKETRRGYANTVKAVKTNLRNFARSFYM